VIREKLDADIEVTEDVIDVPCDLLLSCLNDLIESAQQVVVYIKQELDTPLMLVRKHGFDQLVGLIDDLVVSHLRE